MAAGRHEGERREDGDGGQGAADKGGMPPMCLSERGGGDEGGGTREEERGTREEGGGTREEGGIV
jgi:hypothetical protein